VGLWQGWVNNSSADAVMIVIAAAQKSNKLCKVSASDMVCGVFNMSSREDYLLGQEVVGENVCLTRLQNVTSCGTLLSTNITQGVCRTPTDCRTMKYMRRATYTGAAGDSGGAIYYGNKAIGLHSAPYAYAGGGEIYSHVINVEDTFGLTTQLTP
jgi:hypothetical protein